MPVSFFWRPRLAKTDLTCLAHRPAHLCIAPAGDARTGAVAALANTDDGCPAPVSPPAAAAPAEPSPAAVSLAREVIVGSGIVRSFDLIVPQFPDQIGTNIHADEARSHRDLNAVMEQIKPDFDKQTQDLVTSSARLYAQRLSESQLRDISAFFKSPAGAGLCHGAAGRDDRSLHLDAGVLAAHFYRHDDARAHRDEEARSRPVIGSCRP